MGDATTYVIRPESYSRGNKIVGKLADGSWKEFDSKSDYMGAYMDSVTECLSEAMIAYEDN